MLPLSYKATLHHYVRNGTPDICATEVFWYSGTLQIELLLLLLLYGAQQALLLRNLLLLIISATKLLEPGGLHSKMTGMVDEGSKCLTLSAV